MKGTIIYYGGFSLPDKNAAANRVVSNGKILVASGYNVVFLGADYEQCDYDGIRALSRNMFSEAHPAGATQWLRQIVLFKNLKQAVAEHKNTELIILYNVPFVTLCLAKRFFGKQGIDVAYDCTEWSQFTEGSLIKRVFKYIDEFFIRKFTHKVADKIIVISKLMENAYSSNRKILKLPPLVDLSDDIWHQPKENSADKFVFCFAGFPGGNKENLDVVVNAFMKLNQDKAVLRIVGLEREQFCAMYPGIEPSPQVEFSGKLTHRETIKQILSCDCYVFIRPSDRRNNAGFPTKFAESYTCGARIITTDVSDIRDYTNNSEDFIILNTTDTDTVHNAMLSMMHSDHSQRVKSLRNDFDYKNYIDKAQRWLN